MKRFLKILIQFFKQKYEESFNGFKHVGEFMLVIVTVCLFLFLFFAGAVVIGIAANSIIGLITGNYLLAIEWSIDNFTSTTAHIDWIKGSYYLVPIGVFTFFGLLLTTLAFLLLILFGRFLKNNWIRAISIIDQKDNKK